MRFGDMMVLTEHGPDTYVASGPRYPWGGLYGGQVVAQALRAAAITIDPRYRVHSLHAYFLRPGDHDQPVRYHVERTRDGRSFATRAVVAHQDAAIVDLQVSFQLDRGTPDVAPDGPGADLPAADLPAADPAGPGDLPGPAQLPGPDDLPDDSWTPMMQRRMLPSDPGRAAVWARIDGLDDDPVLAACALAYLSDDLPADVVAAALCDGRSLDEVYGTSLDHAIWFHRTVPTAAWLLFDHTAEGLQPPRGLVLGRVRDGSGAHLATVAQEVIVRERH